MHLAMLFAARLAVTIATADPLVSSGLATATAAQAAAVWRAAGVELEWSVGDRPGGAPAVPVIYVVFSDRCPATPSGEMPIGSITFVNGEPMRRIVICHNQAIALAETAEPAFTELPQRVREVLLARVMGRAVAHEVGHFLLGRAHASTGLMRASHSAADFCAADSAAFAVATPPRVAQTLPVR